MISSSFLVGIGNSGSESSIVEREGKSAQCFWVSLSLSLVSYWVSLSSLLFSVNGIGGKAFELCELRTKLFVYDMIMMMWYNHLF